MATFGKPHYPAAKCKETQQTLPNSTVYVMLKRGNEGDSTIDLVYGHAKSIPVQVTIVTEPQFDISPLGTDSACDIQFDIYVPNPESDGTGTSEDVTDNATNNATNEADQYNVLTNNVGHGRTGVIHVEMRVDSNGCVMGSRYIDAPRYAPIDGRLFSKDYVDIAVAKHNFVMAPGCVIIDPITKRVGE